jgi:ABC-type phosphate transport system substrate-binding protein
MNAAPQGQDMYYQPRILNPDEAKPVDSVYRRYSCQQGNPLDCAASQTSSQAGGRVKYCPVCEFPAILAEQSEIQGQSGTYRIEAWIGSRGLGRLYRATLLGLNQSVTIKEYLLPQRHFNPDEIRQRQKTFKNSAGISLADGRDRDFRLLSILEAIADSQEERCYLVLEEASIVPSLRTLLAQGSFSGEQVYRVLYQVLQSLKFLHSQIFRLPSGQMSVGLVHGNISLDSLLIKLNSEDKESALNWVNYSVQENNTDFFIYLCELNLWEGLFLPPLVRDGMPSVEDDLIALGYVAFYLLAARVGEDSWTLLDPKNDRDWPIVDLPLKQFILRLLKIGQPFESADAALQELLRSPPPVRQIHSPPPAPSIEAPRTKVIPLWLKVLSIVLLLALLGWIASLLYSKLFAKPAKAKMPQLCCLKAVSGIPAGAFTYTAVRDGIGQYIFQQKNLLRQGENLEQLLKGIQPQLKLSLEPTPSIDEAIADVRLGKAEFAIAPLLQPLREDLEAQTIAYDGVAVFVAFSYAKRDKSIPVHLNGSLDLKHLQQIYTTKIETWQDLNGPPLPLQRYWPQNKEVTEVFRQRILSKGSVPTLANSDNQPNPSPIPEFEMMRTVIRDFELRGQGSIGFAAFSKVVGQCSVYPLALNPLNQLPIQALSLNNGKAISPATDLCSKKGTYALDLKLFQTGKYPLAYPLAVIYPRDNSRSNLGEKMAEILKTQEGQRLLAETGLVPLEAN